MVEECTNNPGDLASSPNCINAMASARLAGQRSLRTLPPLQLPLPHSSGGLRQAASSKNLADTNKRSPGLTKED
jgi:hypothetical protein